LNRKWKDAAHLIRPAVVFLAGLLIFLGLRSALVPSDFGKWGHYRAGALEEIRSKPLRYAGKETCAGCHVEQAGQWEAGKHARVACEACHGPAAAHAADFDKVKPASLDIASLCSGCHEKDAAKPSWFRQVASAEHSGGAGCEGCHQPHHPKL
jgi:hypothetical protein